MYAPTSSMGIQQFSPVVFSTLPPEAFSDAPPTGPPPLPASARGGGMFQQAPQPTPPRPPPRGPRDTQQLRPPAAMSSASIIPGVPNLALGAGAALVAWFLFFRR